MSSVRDGEVGSNCVRCVRKTWKVSGMEGEVASSRHGALDGVSTKCGEDPFLYATVYHCRKSIIFCKRLGAEARSFWKIDWSGWWSVWTVMSDFPSSHWSNLLKASIIARHSFSIFA